MKHVIYPDLQYKPTSAVIKGYDFKEGPHLEKIMQHLKTTGLQASCLGQAIDIIN